VDEEVTTSKLNDKSRLDDQENVISSNEDLVRDKSS